MARNDGREAHAVIVAALLGFVVTALIAFGILVGRFIALL